MASSLRSNPSLSEESIRATLRSKKEELMAEVYTIMTATLGVPPKPDAPFTWDYYDAEGKAHTWKGTPLEFYKAFYAKSYAPSDCFSLINDPRNDYGKLYTVDKLGNVWGGRPVLYVNTKIDDLKMAVVKMVKAGIPVFFGCDVGKSSDRVKGLMNADLYEYEVCPALTELSRHTSLMQCSERFQHQIGLDEGSASSGPRICHDSRYGDLRGTP
jgi:bleomycin hydrolase